LIGKLGIVEDLVYTVSNTPISLPLGASREVKIHPKKGKARRGLGSIQVSGAKVS